MNGFIEMALEAEGAVRRVWQQVVDGCATGYFAEDGTPVLLPEVYEMTIVDARLQATIGRV